MRMTIYWFSSEFCSVWRSCDVTNFGQWKLNTK